MKALFAAAALAALPMAASAVTVPVTEVSPGFYYATTGVASVVNDVFFDFTVPVELEDVTVSISGTGLPASLDKITYTIGGMSYSVPYTSGFVDIYEFATVMAGTYTVSFDFSSPVTIPVSLTVTAFGSVPEVPVPAAGALAAGGVIALGALKARRKAKKA